MSFGRLSPIFLLVILINALVAIPVQAQSEDENIQITAEVIYQSATIYVFPSHRAREIATLNEGDVMTVLYREDSREGLWVRIDVGGVTGWMDGAYLYFSQANWKRYVPILPPNQLRNPEFVETDDLTPPIETETASGYAGAYVIRPQPFRDSEVLMSVDFDVPVEVLAGAQVNGTWSRYVYVRHLESGVEGWIVADYVQGDGYDHIVGWINPNLPVYDFTAYLPASENPINQLPARTGANAYLRPHAYALTAAPSHVGISLDYLPSGTELTISGRTDCRFHDRCWFEVRYANKVGWLWMGYLIIDGDYMRLPIVPQ